MTRPTGRFSPGRPLFVFVACNKAGHRWAPHGFAAIPTPALDPSHATASPAVPALSWVRVPFCYGLFPLGGAGFDSNTLHHASEFTRQFGMVLAQIGRHRSIAQ